MRLMVFVVFAAMVLAFCLHLVLIAKGSYPIHRTTTVQQAVLGLVWEFALAAWAAWLLWGARP